MTAILITLLVILSFVVLYQIGQASELSTILKEEERTNRKRNTWMAWSFLLMFPLLMGFFWYTHKWFDGKLTLNASNHGIEYEKMFFYTLIVTGIVFVITQFLLFFYAFKYRDNNKRTSFFFAHSNMLEIIWTTVPAIAMAILVAIGLINWFKMTSEAPAGSQRVEVIGKQFNWMMRYPGADNKLGLRNFKLIDDAKGNELGLDFTDPNTKDDIVITNGELHLEKGKPVELIIGSRDVIHDVGLPHFRMKMDAVPGIATRMWFTPLFTTEEMKLKTNNPNFVYEISCDQMCGKGHYSMRGTVIVHEPGGLAKWLSDQKSAYSKINAAPADSTKPMATETVKDTVKKISMLSK
jgi:cytochrome c oxidase subunit II